MYRRYADMYWLISVPTSSTFHETNQFARAMFALEELGGQGLMQMISGVSPSSAVAIKQTAVETSQPSCTILCGRMPRKSNKENRLRGPQHAHKGNF
jgi:hypothetical protein